MGQGGQVIIVNATAFPFQLQGSQTNENQMKDWSFPQTINPGTNSGRIYIEYSKSIFDNPNKDLGNATYMIADGAGNPTFQIQARSPDNFLVQLEFLSLNMANNAPDSTTVLQVMDSSLGSTDWDCAKVVIAGSPGQYIGTNPPTNWMQTMLPILQSRTLRQVCLPASHDSGMNVISSPTHFSGTGNTKTQTLSVGQQLAAGVRYFDIRASLNGTTYGTAHFSDTHSRLGWQGSFGQPMAEIIQQVNAFTATNPELIIFDVSHAMNLTGYEDNNVQYFTADEYTGLLQMLQQVNNRCTIIPDLTTDASLKTVGEFIGNGKASVLFVIRDSQADLTNFAGQGFINDGQLKVYNKYADSDDLNTVIAKEIRYLREQRTSPDSPMFMAAWIQTLTSALDNVYGNILKNTIDLNKALFQELWNACSASSYPNILQVDGVDSTVTALAIAINYTFGPTA